jgi:hypothetical protein
MIAGVARQLDWQALLVDDDVRFGAGHGGSKVVRVQRRSTRERLHRRHLRGGRGLGAPIAELHVDDRG